MLTVYLDSSIWLSFYGFTNDKLEELSKLREKIDEGHLRVILPDQVLDEVHRNRERTLVQTRAVIEKVKRPKQGWPKAIGHFEQIVELDRLAEQFEQLRGEVADLLMEQAKAEELPADRTIRELFEAAQRLLTSPELIERAQVRRALGNPPGKATSLGDQLIWETLLEFIDEGADLHIVARDGDFQSELVPGAPNPFLKREWREVKGAELHYHPSLASFASASVVNVALDLDIAEDEPDISPEVQRLVVASSYAGTHLALSALGDRQWFTPDEVHAIARAFQENDQFHAIKGDVDVRQFLKRFANNHWVDFTSEEEEALAEFVPF